MHPLQRVKIAIARRKLSSRSIAEGSELPLEVWTLAKVRETWKSSPELRSKLGKKDLDTVTPEDVKEYQLQRFRDLLLYVQENSIFYRKKLKEAGVTPKEIKTWDDLERVPLTEPADLAAEPFHFLCVSQSKVMRAFTTSGTTGTKKRLFFTQKDILNTIDAISAALRTIGMKESDTLQIMFPTVAAWDPGLMLDGACKVAGFNSVIGSMVDVDQQIKLMRESHTTMIIGLTSFIHRVTMLAKDRYNLRSLGIKAIICSAEPLPEIMRREIEEAWGCPALSQYGLTEMGLANAIECRIHDGMHINAADFLIEVIDPATGKHVKEREPGELVFTSFNMEGTPLVRYRTYDMSSYINPPCPCGWKAVGKIGKVSGRLDALTKIGLGEKVFPLLFDEAVLSIPGVLNYRVIIETAGYRERLTFQVEMNSKSEEAKEKLINAISQLPEIHSGLENDLLEPPIVELLEPDSIGFTPKTNVIVDKRKLYDAK